MRRRSWARGADLSRPQWVFGMRSFAWHPDGSIAAVALDSGRPLLEVGTLERGTLARATPRSQANAARIDEPVAFGERFAAVISPPTAMPAVMCIGRGGLKPIAGARLPLIDAGLPQPRRGCEFRNARRENRLGIHYAPTNAAHSGPAGALPPALVLAHGGPTSMTDAGLKMRVQFYTSRGFAVLDVNYSGSTGFGRAYRERLDGQWGIADVADCAAAARFLAREGLADAERIAIAGGSAGGYTTLMALGDDETPSPPAAVTTACPTWGC